MKATHRHLGDLDREYHKDKSTGTIYFKTRTGVWIVSSFTYTGTFDRVSVKINTFKGNK